MMAPSFLYLALVSVSACAMASIEEDMKHDVTSLVNEPPFVNTSQWLGSSYTPSSASNSLWWWRFEDYRQEVTRELAWARTQLGFQALRMFLHSSVYDGDGGKTLLTSMGKYVPVQSCNIDMLADSIQSCTCTYLPCSMIFMEVQRGP